MPALWLGGAAACLTALGLVVGVLDRAPASSASPPAATVAPAQASAPPPSAASGALPASVPTTAVVAEPVLVAGASIPPLADLIARVGGPRVEVVSVVPQGVDGHTYEPTPSDVQDLARADIKFFASVDLNPAVTRTAEANLPADAVRVDLMTATMSDDEVLGDSGHSHGSGGSHSHANVHTWTDPTIGLRWVSEIARQLTAIDPAGAGDYSANATALMNQIQAVHDATVAATATIPEPNRTLVVYHDSWSYFGRTYGYRVLGALQAADFAEPSAAEVRDMVEQVRGSGAPAFFGAAVFPAEVLERVSEEAGVPYVANLADDELPGEPGEARHGYVGMMVENVRHIVTSLGGDPSILDGVAL
jgi:ABC-type Zn uptake system ZnuABC Zn-binding protein ZnuA